MNRLAAAEHLVSARWHLGVGDHYAVAWVIVGAYALAAVLSLRAWLVARADHTQLVSRDPDEAAKQRLLARWWAAVAVVMVVLGINKQLDLQTLVIQTVRDRAVQAGWYGRRRHYQVEFIAVVGLAGLVATIGLAVALRRVLGRVLLSVAGLGLLVCYVLIRASSYHDVDWVLARGGRFRLSWLFELGGVVLIGLAAVRFAHRRPAPEYVFGQKPAHSAGF